MIDRFLAWIDWLWGDRAEPIPPLPQVVYMVRQSTEHSFNVVKAIWDVDAREYVYSYPHPACQHLTTRAEAIEHMRRDITGRFDWEALRTAGEPWLGLSEEFDINGEKLS